MMDWKFFFEVIGREKILTTSTFSCDIESLYQVFKSRYDAEKTMTREELLTWKDQMVIKKD